MLRASENACACYFANDELNISIISLVRIGEYKGKKYAHKIFESDWQQVDWRGYVDLIEKLVKFAHQGNIIIPSKNFRDRGLGCYIFSDLIKWVKEHYLEYSLEDLCIKAIDEKVSDGETRTKAFYQKFGFPAKTALELREYRNHNKIESVSLKEFLPALLIDNSNL